MFSLLIRLLRHLSCVASTHNIVSRPYDALNRFGGVLLFVILLVPVNALGDDKDAVKKKTNLEVMQELLGQAARQIVDQSHIPSADTIHVRLKPHDDGWIAQTSIVSTLRAMGYEILVGDTSLIRGRYLIDISSSQLQVRYDDMFHDGFLGKKKVRRTINITFTCQTIRTSSGEVLWSDSPIQQFVDTVAVDEISNLELSSVKSTQSSLPSEAFIDKVIEPFVILGATGVAVYLFFHVRS
jgi:hypothetical protein